MDVWVTPPVQELKTVDLSDEAAQARAVWSLARWRASPAVRFCRPAAGAVVEGQRPQPDAAQAFRAQLAAAGVSIREEAGPACQRGDDNWRVWTWARDQPRAAIASSTARAARSVSLTGA